MTVRKMNDPNLFAIEMDRNRLVKGDYRQRLFRRRFYGLAHYLLFSLKPLSDVCLRDDGSLGAEGAVAPGVVAVIVSVQDKLQLSGIQGMEGGTNSFGQGSKLIVDDQYAVFACGHSNVATCSFEHVDIPGDFGRL